MMKTFDIIAIDNSKVNEEEVLASLSRKEKPGEALLHQLNNQLREAAFDGEIEEFKKLV